MLRAEFQTQIKPSQQTRSVDVVASTPAVDSYGRVVLQDWDLSRYAANPVVLWNHGMSWGSDDATLPIGYAENVRVEDGKLLATIHFVDEKANPMAEKIYQGYLQGSLRAVSVGWDAEEAAYDEESETLVLSQNKLIEISAVAIPANPEAVRLAASMFDGMHSLREIMRKASEDQEKEKDDDMKATIEEKDKKIAELEEKLEAIRGLLASVGASSVQEASGIVAAMKSSHSLVSELKAEVEALRKAKSDAEFAAVVDEARKAGKFVAANEAGLVAAAKGDIETLKAIVAHMPVVANVSVAKTPEVGAPALSDGELAKCKANGWDPLKYAEMKRKLSHPIAVQEGNE